MTAFYLDSSVALHAVLHHSRSAIAWLDTTVASADDLLLSSRLLRTELTRVLRREQVEPSRGERVLDYVTGVPLTEHVLTTAEALEPHVKTLDAIHLASAIATGLRPTIVTHDAGMTRVAHELGYPTYDPVAA